jgi:hypothetical protein
MDDEMRIGQPLAAGSAVDRAGRLASRQFGTIARRQLLAMGNPSSRISNWLDTRRLHRVLLGVYAWGRADLSEAGLLAARLLYAGPGSALTGVGALWWLGLLQRRPSVVEIAAPGRTSSRPGLRIVHPANLRRSEVRGLPVASLPSVLLVAAPELGHSTLRLVLARAEFERLLDLRELQAAMAGGPRGSRRLRAALDAHLPQLAACANGRERDFVLLCERSGLPIPDPNTKIGRYRPDMLWPDRGLIVEIDGKRAHSTAAQLAADAQRQAHLESLGYRVVRFAAGRIVREPERIAAELRRLLG